MVVDGESVMVVIFRESSNGGGGLVVPRCGVNVSLFVEQLYIYVMI